MSAGRIEIRATVRNVSEVGVSLEPLPDAENDEAITPVNGEGHIWISFAPDENGEKARAFGALMKREGAVRITVEPAAA